MDHTVVGLLALTTLDFLGTIAFAMTGALKAVRGRMDIFGVMVLALATAIGGGTFRDLLLRRPVFWLDEPAYVLLSLVAAAFVFLLYRWVAREEQLVLVLDAIGLGVFTAIGAMKAHESGVGAVGVVTLACMTGVGGGLLRDLLANDVPVVLREEVYASASIAGALLFWYVLQLGGPPFAAIAAATVLTVTIRMVSMLRKWRLPRVELDEGTGA